MFVQIDGGERGLNIQHYERPMHFMFNTSDYSSMGAIAPARRLTFFLGVIRTRHRFWVCAASVTRSGRRWDPPDLIVVLGPTALDHEQHRLADAD
jgi:hypothetical protein